MPLRRFHTKSRHGCSQCKLAHVKCSRCTKLQKTCSFQNLYKAPSESSGSSPNAGTSITTINHLSETDTLSWEDLDLFHHYLTVTCETLDDREDVRQMWKIQIPQMATKQKFLMYGIFSITAMHIASSNPENQSSYINRAIRDHNIALRDYTSLLHNITRENATALFACGSLIAVVALTLGILRPQQESTGPVEEILGIFNLLRGIPLVAGKMWASLRSSQIAPLFVHRDHDGREVDLTASTRLPERVTNALALLEERAQTLSTPEQKEAYIIAIQDLKEAFNLRSAVRYEKSMSFRWPVTVNQEYVALLGLREPMALVVLAHYAVMLHEMRDKWWALGWGSQLVHEIYQVVDEDWRGLMAWPMREISPNHEHD
ncbi:uncharacterized protein LY89DRAFT_673533 [Mollisia scopiformis]|uniref:Zn(2)-C6 fungal-type domain-containing protein n=1 Tax=Mollisia scopiformis TaxID=149040 RepID=A0A194WX67_MOLSC|nr:uncharacterized protein LY89DRAFT_673533 [Mollisia scopiformis]KUJ12578.1 hypothetical protein LY89DRAFT_673533 [Mollisia scopiformis]